MAVSHGIRQDLGSICCTIRGCGCLKLIQCTIMSWIFLHVGSFHVPLRVEFDIYEIPNGDRHLHDGQHSRHLMTDSAAHARHTILRGKSNDQPGSVPWICDSLGSGAMTIASPLSAAVLLAGLQHTRLLLTGILLYDMMFRSGPLAPSPSQRSTTMRVVCCTDCMLRRTAPARQGGPFLKASSHPLPYILHPFPKHWIHLVSAWTLDRLLLSPSAPTTDTKHSIGSRVV